MCLASSKEILWIYLSWTRRCERPFIWAVLTDVEHGESSRSQMKVSTNGFNGGVKPLENTRKIN